MLSKNTIRLSDYTVDFLQKHYGIDTYFLVSGGGCIFLCDSVGSNPKIKYIATHHEQIASIATEGYARINNKMSVCLVTSGPGGTNAITGVLGAWLDSTPMLVISGQVNKNMTTNYTGLPLRQLGDQEFNIVETVSNMTKYAVQINDPKEIRYHLEKAYHLATSGRPGPVWLDIPLDVQSAMINSDELIEYTPNTETPEVTLDQIDQIVEKLKTSNKPLLIIGNGVRLSGAINDLKELVEKLKIPVISAVNGNDILSRDNKYYCGRFGTHAQMCANNLINECDLLISIGSRLYIRQTGYAFKSFAENAYKIYVDIDSNELNKPTLFPDLPVCSDAKIFIRSLITNIDDSLNHLDWTNYSINKYKTTPRVLDRHRNSQKYISHYATIEKIGKYLPNDYHIVTSDGSANVVTMQVLDLANNQRLITNTGSAPMGHGLPCAIGASINHKILCIDGDGSMHLSINALQTIKHYNLPIKIVLLNNQGYLSIKLTQQSLFNGKYIGSESSSGVTFPDFEKIFKAYNISYVSIKNNNELDTKLKEFFSNDEQGVCEIFTDPQEKHEPRVFPKLNDDGTFIPGQLHDIRWSE